MCTSREDIIQRVKAIGGRIKTSLTLSGCPISLVSAVGSLKYVHSLLCYLRYI